MKQQETLGPIIPRNMKKACRQQKRKESEQDLQLKEAQRNMKKSNGKKKFREGSIKGNT